MIKSGMQVAEFDESAYSLLPDLRIKPTFAAEIIKTKYVNSN